MQPGGQGPIGDYDVVPDVADSWLLLLAVILVFVAAFVLFALFG